MPKKMKFNVVREHYGDKPYVTGDERIALEADVKHLIPHVLEPIGEVDEPEADEGEKAEAEHLNKAEPEHANKATTGRKAKGE